MNACMLPRLRFVWKLEPLQALVCVSQVSSFWRSDGGICHGRAPWRGGRESLSRSLHIGAWCFYDKSMQAHIFPYAKPTMQFHQTSSSSRRALVPPHALTACVLLASRLQNYLGQFKAQLRNPLPQTFVSVLASTSAAAAQFRLDRL